MKHSKDPFEVAYEEQEKSPPESPTGQDDDLDNQTAMTSQDALGPPDVSSDLPPEDDEMGNSLVFPSDPSSLTTRTASSRSKAKIKDDEDDGDEENVDVELAKLPTSSDPDKMVKMKSILSQFTDDQMSRYESFRRSALQKPNMRRLLVSVTGSQKISLPMTIVVCGIAKMFVGDLVETARMVMSERRESGPIRPCHIREAYRRLKLEGKVLKRSVPRLFH